MKYDFYKGRPIPNIYKGRPVPDFCREDPKLLLQFYSAVDEEEKMFRMMSNALILLAALNVIPLVVSIIALFASMR